VQELHKARQSAAAARHEERQTKDQVKAGSDVCHAWVVFNQAKADELGISLAEYEDGLRMEDLDSPGPYGDVTPLSKAEALADAEFEKCGKFANALKESATAEDLDPSQEFANAGSTQDFDSDKEMPDFGDRERQAKAVCQAKVHQSWEFAFRDRFGCVPEPPVPLLTDRGISLFPPGTSSTAAGSSGDGPSRSLARSSSVCSVSLSADTLTMGKLSQDSPLKVYGSDCD